MERRSGRIAADAEDAVETGVADAEMMSVGSSTRYVVSRRLARGESRGGTRSIFHIA
jgi:hypothetical protein